jgi:hypothetical protein
MDKHEVFLEIGAGGVKFEVVRDFRGRPLLVVEATHYGQKTNTLQLLTNSDALAKLGEMFTAASKEDYPGVEYVYAAKPFYACDGSGDAESCGQEEN